MRRCNRTVADYVASGFTIPEDHAITNHPDGSVIRALLRTRPHGLAAPPDNAVPQDHTALFEDMSLRILDLHHQDDG